jgi:hypothetical protein
MSKSPSPMGNLTLRIDDALRAELEAAAERDRRPVGNLIRCVLSDWVERRAVVGEREAAA